MVAPENTKSAPVDAIDAKVDSQVAAATFADRFNDARRGMTPAEVARRSGISPQLVSEYRYGKKVPGVDYLFALADALKVNPRWLFSGEGERSALTALDDGSIVMLPRRDLFHLGDGYSATPLEEIPVRREWLIRAARTDQGLWLAEMPSDAVPDVAREGETIVCRDIELPLQDRWTCIFLLDGRPIVRRVQARRGGVVLASGDPSVDPIALTDQFPDDIIPVGRVIAAISLRSV